MTVTTSPCLRKLEESPEIPGSHRYSSKPGMARPVTELLGRSGLLSGAAVPNVRRLALPLAAFPPSRRLNRHHHHHHHHDDLHHHHNHHLRTGPLSRGLGSARAQRRPASTSSARRPGGEPLYPGHIVTTGAQKTLLAVGSAVTALLDPTRHDMVAALGETTAGAALVSMRDRMAADPVGASILADRPRVSEAAVDMPRLRGLGPDTFGERSWQRDCDRLSSMRPFHCTLALRTADRRPHPHRPRTQTAAAFSKPPTKTPH